MQDDHFTVLNGVIIDIWIISNIFFIQQNQIIIESRWKGGWRRASGKEEGGQVERGREGKWKGGGRANGKGEKRREEARRGREIGGKVNEKGLQSTTF